MITNRDIRWYNLVKHGMTIIDYQPNPSDSPDFADLTCTLWWRYCHEAVCEMGETITRPGKRWHFANWKDPAFFMGKLTISTGPFSPEGIPILSTTWYRFARAWVACSTNTRGINTLWNACHWKTSIFDRKIIKLGAVKHLRKTTKFDGVWSLMSLIKTAIIIFKYFKKHIGDDIPVYRFEARSMYTKSCSIHPSYVTSHCYCIPILMVKSSFCLVKSDLAACPPANCYRMT